VVKPPPIETDEDDEEVKIPILNNNFAGFNDTQHNSSLEPEFQKSNVHL